MTRAARATKTTRIRRSGMTRVELMALLGVVGVLASAAGVSMVRAMGDGAMEEARAEVDALTTAANAYIRAHGDRRCPTVSHLRDARLVAEDTSHLDPWNVPFAIDCEGGEARALSAGPDQRYDTTDDI